MTSRPNAADPDLSVRYDLADSAPSPIAKRYSEWLGDTRGPRDAKVRRPKRNGPRRALRHFLLLHDPRRRRLDVMEFDDAAAAIAAYSALELEHLGQPDLEIVLLGADSLDTIRKTHGHYFSIADVRLPGRAQGRPRRHPSRHARDPLALPRDRLRGRGACSALSSDVDPDEDVELGAQVEARTRGSAGAVVAVRVPQDLLTRISEYAKFRGLTVSAVMREGVERLALGTVLLTDSVSGPRVEGLRIIPGSPSRGGRGRTMEIDEVKSP